MRTAARQYKHQIFMWLPFVLAVMVWSISALIVPSFDLDEALYRQSAIEMKQTKNYLWPTWGGEYYADKPPTFIWLIVAISYLFDKGTEVSFLSARFPGLLSSLFIFLLLGFTWKKINQNILKQEEKYFFLSHFTFPGTLLMLGFLPFMGATAILIDPLLTLAFTPLLCFFTIWFMENNTSQQAIKRKYFFWVMLPLCILFACALKGPVGFIIPSFALFTHCLLSAVFTASSLFDFCRSFYKNICQTLNSFFLPFLCGLLLAALFYLFIYTNGGKKVVQDFLIVQNFQRSVKTFEGHSGGIFYHFLVVVLGGSGLILIVLWATIQLKTHYKQLLPYRMWGFPLSWILSILVLFSSLATKLPNYTWPVWPAIALVGALFIAFLSHKQTANLKKHSQILKILFYSFAALFCGVGIALIFSLNIFDYIIKNTAIDQRVKIVLKELGPLPANLKIGLAFVGGIILLQMGILLHNFRIYHWQVIKTFKGIFLIAILNSLNMLVILFFIVPFTTKTLWQPMIHLTLQAEKITQRQKATFSTLGLKSPTVSSSYTLSVVSHYLKGEVTRAFAKSDVILMPMWFAEKCRENNFEIIAKESYFILCKKILLSKER
ncbi:MAG: hypothetical protein K2X39_02115 [Silvanigrellaceae bacterium]|nr:hypothetical protein [Silvanigrellaceae bacterium]